MGVFSFIAKKCFAALATLFFVIFCTFLLGRAIPGGPFDGEKQQLPHIKALQEAKYGFDKGPVRHFFVYFRDLILERNLGVSIKFVDRPVSKILSETLPSSITIGFLALTFALLLGIPLGILSASRPNSWVDTSAICIAVSGITLPSFLVGTLVVLLFSHTLGWLPPARLEGPEYYILPVLTLGVRPAAILARMTRSSLLEQLSCDYVRTARAKGASPVSVILRHCFRNALVPIVTVLGPIMANILTGSFVVEHFFAIPGVAKHFIDAITNRDVYLMMGVTLVFSSLMITINLITELVYPLLDPRIRL